MFVKSLNRCSQNLEGVAIVKSLNHWSQNLEGVAIVDKIGRKGGMPSSKAS